MALLYVYAIDQKDSWPYPLLDGFVDPYNHNRFRLDTPYTRDAYTWVEAYWHAPLVASYDLDRFDPMLDCPSHPMLPDYRRDYPEMDRAWATCHGLSMAMYLSPQSLREDQPKWDAEYLRVQRHSDVLFPSHKAALYDTEPSHDPGVRYSGRAIASFPPWSVTVAACDGSAQYRYQGACRPAVVFPQFKGPTPEAASLETYFDMFRFTPGGVRGVDW